ncbi:MAG: hypothetical protein JWP91_3966 [Fibrobacteres bacterium]|nr:hypothetical protein [Fibrobacterota bacterium]
MFVRLKSLPVLSKILIVLSVSGGCLTSMAQSLVPHVPARVIQNLEAGKKQTLVAFGTSLTAGGAWVGLLDGYLKEKYPGLATVYNEGASGHGSKYGLTILGNVTRHSPDAVFIEFAMNDAYYPEQDGYKEGVPVETSRANLGEIIDGIKAVNPACEIIPQTMDLPLGIHLKRRPKIAAYYAAYRDFAGAENLVLADHEPNWKGILEFDTAFYMTWLPDSIHPSAAASSIITFPGVLSVLTGARIEIASPAPQAVYAVGAEIELKAVATAPVTRVDFYRGKTLIGSDSTAPFSYTWKGAAAGRYLIMARLMRKETPMAISPWVRIDVKTSTGLQSKGGPDSGAAHGSGLAGKRRVPVYGSALKLPGFWLGRKSHPQ